MEARDGVGHPLHLARPHVPMIAPRRRRRSAPPLAFCAYLLPGPCCRMAWWLGARAPHVPVA